MSFSKGFTSKNGLTRQPSAHQTWQRSGFKHPPFPPPLPCTRPQTILGVKIEHPTPPLIGTGLPAPPPSVKTLYFIKYLKNACFFIAIIMLIIKDLINFFQKSKIIIINMFLKSNNILKQVGVYVNKIKKLNIINFKMRGKGGCGAGISIPRPNPRTKKPKFPPHPHPHLVKSAFPR